MGMDTASSFLGGGSGSSFAPMTGSNYSSGMLNTGGGFGSRGPTAFGQSAFGMANDNGLTYAGFANQQKLQGMQDTTDLQKAQIEAQASTLGARLQQKRFNTVWGSLGGTLKNGLLTGSYSSTVGGQNTPQPASIAPASVWTPDQIQQRVNSMRAGNDQSAATQSQQAQDKMAGRGFGGDSPLMQQLQAMYQGQALAANTQGENDIRWNAAQGNASQATQAANLNEQIWNDWNQADIARRKNVVAQNSALLDALRGLV